MALVNRQELQEPIQKLYDACKAAEENLHAASQQMQNRGLKGLFKRFAQQHRRFAHKLDDLAAQMGFALSSPGRFRNSLQRGWMDIRIAMIVGRANRQSAAAAKSEATEVELLREYDRVLQLPLPEFALAELQEQRDSIAYIHQWVQRVISQYEWIVRLYDTPAGARQAIEQLKGSGFVEDTIEVIPLHQIAQYGPDAEERVHSTVDATLVGALFVGVIGLLLGLLIGYWRPLYDPAVAEVEPVLWGSILGSGLIGALVGASFGSFFGFLLGQGVAEDDASLSEGKNGADATVVSVKTTQVNHREAADILHMRHQRELENAPA